MAPSMVYPQWVRAQQGKEVLAICVVLIIGILVGIAFERARRRQLISTTI